MTRQDLVKKLEDENFLDDKLFEKPIKLEDFRIVQSKEYELEDGSKIREDIASVELENFILDESDESLWNPNGDDPEEFINDMLWD